jgi:hypothetical protein
MTDDPAAITRLIAEIEDALRAVPRNDEAKLRRALSLAAEASRMPRGEHRAEMVRDARALLRQGRRR